MRIQDDFELRLGDVAMFLSIADLGAVSAGARAHGVSPSQATKAVHRLERALKVSLLNREGRGVVLSTAAKRLLPALRDAVSAIRRARSRSSSMDITLAAPSYVLAAVLPVLAREGGTALRFRGLQLAPPTIRASVGRGQFEVALLTGVGELPNHWSSVPLAPLRMGLFAAPAIARQCATMRQGVYRALPKDLAHVPFVLPVSWHDGQWETVVDGCPLAVSDRKVGHEAPTIALALDVAASSNQVTFGPQVAARDHLARGTLLELQVEGWDVTVPLTLAFDIDRMNTTLLRNLQRWLGTAFDSTPT